MSNLPRIRHSIPIRVRIVRVRIQIELFQIRQPIGIHIAACIQRVQRIKPILNLPPIRHPVLIRIHVQRICTMHVHFFPVQYPIPVRVLIGRVRAQHIFPSVGQSIAVRIP